MQNNGKHERGGRDDQIEVNDGNGEGQSDMNPTEGMTKSGEEMAMVVFNQPVEQSTDEQPVELPLFVYPREETTGHPSRNHNAATLREVPTIETLTIQPPPPVDELPIQVFYTQSFNMRSIVDLNLTIERQEGAEVIYYLSIHVNCL